MSSPWPSKWVSETELRITCPFATLAEATLELGETLVRLTHKGSTAEFNVPPTLDSASAAAKFSKKRQELTLTWTRLAASPPAVEPTGTPGAGPVPRGELPACTPTGYPGSQVPPRPPLEAATSTDDDSDMPPPLEGVPSLEHGDDDDGPPPLETDAAAPKRRVQRAPRKPVMGSGVIVDAEDDPEDINSNAANEAWLQAAARRHEKEAQEAKKKAAALEKPKDTVMDTKSNGLKKGFFANSKPKKKTAKAADVEFVEPKAQMPDLRLPEVQAAMKEKVSSLSKDTSWITPELQMAIASHPVLAKGLTNPRIMGALEMLQKDPEKAKKEFEHDKEVTAFIEEFTRMMATHFSHLDKTMGKEQAQAAAAAAAAAAAPPEHVSTSAGPVAVRDVAKQEPAPQVATSEYGPEVHEALQDPLIMQLINQVQQGAQIDPRAIARRSPQTYAKLRLLMEKGLLGMAS